MKLGNIDWNDSIIDFINIKIQKPEVLSELVRKEREYANKKTN